VRRKQKCYKEQRRKDETSIRVNVKKRGEKFREESDEKTQETRKVYTLRRKGSI